MKKIRNIYTVVLFMAVLILGANVVVSAPSATVKTAKPAVNTVIQNAISVNPVSVVNNPGQYLNKNITFDTEFISFTSLGLDYKPALREGSKYIGILIQRSDVKDHVIPLSEMKIFLDRDSAEKHTDLEQGDKIKITGTVFSTALGDPWVDIKTLTVLEKKNKENK